MADGSSARTGGQQRLRRLLAPLAMTLMILASPIHAEESVGERLEAAGQAAAERIMHAMNLIGTPYRKRGESPTQGFDCSGFIRHVFRTAHDIDLPRTARAMYALGSSRAREVSRDALAAGDLLFFRIGRLGKQIDHVGLYLGDRRFVHAPASGGEVRIDSLELPYWQRHYAGARRIVDEDEAGTELSDDDMPVETADADVDGSATDAANAHGNRGGIAALPVIP